VSGPAGLWGNALSADVALVMVPRAALGRLLGRADREDDDRCCRLSLRHAGARALAVWWA
jgi:hypothetical protein